MHVMCINRLLDVVHNSSKYFEKFCNFIITSIDCVNGNRQNICFVKNKPEIYSIGKIKAFSQLSNFKTATLL